MGTSCNFFPSLQLLPEKSWSTHLVSQLLQLPPEGLSPNSPSSENWWRLAFASSLGPQRTLLKKIKKGIVHPNLFFENNITPIQKYTRLPQENDRPSFLMNTNAKLLTNTNQQLIKTWLVWSVDWAPDCEAKGCQFNSQSGYMSGLQPRSRIGGTGENTTQWCFFSLPFFLPPLPSL